MSTQPQFTGRLIGPYQKHGKIWMQHREKCAVQGGILCDEMGLGKTVQMLSVVCEDNPGSKTLVVLPKTLMRQWAEETSTFTNLRFHMFENKHQDKFDQSEYDIVFATYNSFHSQECKLFSFEWDRLILDEGHIIRNPKTIAYRHLSTLLHCNGPKWILTGTPIFNSQADMVSLLHFVGFERSYVRHNLLLCQREFVLRRTREDIAKISERLVLPDCEITNVEIDAYPVEKEHYKKVFQNQVQEIEFAEKWKQNMVILESILRTRQASIHPHVFDPEIELENVYHSSAKIDTLVSMTMRHPSEKTIVFCHFKKEIRLVKEHLVRTGEYSDDDVLCMNGDLNTHIRSELFDKFKADAKVLVIQIQIGGVGLNLQEATRIYMLSPSWNPATELQAIARAHRTGQTQKVYVKRLIYSDMDEFPSIDKVLIDLQQQKSCITAKVLEDERLKCKLPCMVTNMDMKAFARFFMGV